MGYQYSNQLPLNVIFKEFLDSVNQISNDSALGYQKDHYKLMGALYHLIQEFGPAFISGDCITSLNDMKERKIRDIIKEFLELISKGKVKNVPEEELSIPSS